MENIEACPRSFPQYLESTDAVDLSTVRSSVDRAIEAISHEQDEAGWWCYEDESNCTLDAEMIAFFFYLKIEDRPEIKNKIQAIARWIRSQQREDGTWALYYDGPGNISVTVEAYFGLRLAGDNPDEEHMIRARKWILENGGINRARVLTKIFLALFGCYDWRGCPALPVQMMLMPDLFRFSIYQVSYWARVCTVPLAILSHVKKEQPLPFNLRELWVVPPEDIDWNTQQTAPFISWRNFFIQSDKVFRWMAKAPVRPFENYSLKRAEAWVLEHQDDSGDWGGIFPAMANSLMALYALGYTIDNPVMVKGIEALERLEHWRGDTLHMAPCVSPVWDTAWIVLALTQGGLPHDDPRIKKATDWLYSMQIRKPGDWAVKAFNLQPGGWAFQFYNDFYPDTDDSAVVLMSLFNSDMSTPEHKEAFKIGVEWLLGLQNEDGGWGAFERDVDDEVFNEILYNDEKNMLDPSTVDVTGRILELLGYLGCTKDDPAVAAGLEFIRREHEQDGSFWGRWGVNFIYGTWSVLRALVALDLHDDPMVTKAADWLESVQNEDGGWGEGCQSYEAAPLPMAHTTGTPNYARVNSTASQTAWAILALLAAGRADSDPVTRGVQWLLNSQPEDGLWKEPEFTGTGFPCAFYLRYDGYPRYFPILALSTYFNAFSDKTTNASSKAALADPS